MNDLTPYERFLAGNLQNLPLPDEDVAWSEMKKLLEEKDDDRPLIATWLKGCLPWLVGVLLLGSGALLWYNWQNSGQLKTGDDKSTRGSHEVQQKSADTSVRSSITVSKATQEDPPNGDQDDASTSPVKLTNPVIETGESQTGSLTEGSAGRSIAHGVPGTTKIRSTSPGVANINGKDSKEEGTGTRRNTSRPGVVDGKVSAKVSRPASVEDQKEIVARNDNPTIKKNAGDSAEVNDFAQREIEQEKTPVNDTISELTEIVPGVENSVSQDSAKVLIADSVKKIQPASKDSLKVADSTGNTRKKRTPFTFAAGLAVNQFIPFDGEKPVPYDYFGRKSSLGDYIPSVYLRAMKPRWFIQSEFRYGAPNAVKEFVYSKKTTIDTFQNTSTSLKTLKKTFYHQIPLTFHYFITKNWSVGVGIAYNKFTRAVRQEDVRLGFPGTITDTLISSNIVQDGKDSAFVSHSFQWIAETQYRWKRFSLGLRFAQGLQPYIKYTDPESGLPAEKRNQSLNAFLRYDLWRSKKK